MDIKLMTELDAINLMLETIGEAPINSLEVSGLADLAVAKRTLQETAREVQSEGWNWNTEENVRFIPDIDGYVNLPSNILRVEPTYRYLPYIGRGVKLYNKETRTYIFTEAVYLNITTFLSFEELPDCARMYIAIKSARRFQNKVMGSDAVYQYTADDEEETRVTLLQHELDTGNYNILDNSPALRR